MAFSSEPLIDPFGIVGFPHRMLSCWNVRPSSRFDPITIATREKDPSATALLGAAGVGAGPSRSGRPSVPAGRAAAGELPLQARAGARRGLWHAAAEPRRALHARIAQALESQFAEIAESLPEVLARHYAEAGNVEKAAVLWGKAGQRSAQRSALVEAAEQLQRALNLIKSLPGTPALRREEIKLQVELITPLLHVRGYAAPETRAAEERALLLIEQAQALGEPPEDPLLLFSALYGSWAANIVAFNGDVMRELAVEFLALAEKQSATGPPMIGHRLMGLSLLHTGQIAGGRAHLDRAIAFYDPAEHRHLATRFGQDVGASALAWRSLALLLLGYPQEALADAVRALKIARQSRHSGTLIYVLNFSVFQHVYCGHFAAANALIDEFDILKDQIGSVFWGGWGTVQRGCVLALTGKVTEAVQNIASGIAEMRSTGTTLWMPLFLSHLALANAEIGQLVRPGPTFTKR